MEGCWKPQTTGPPFTFPFTALSPERVAVLLGGGDRNAFSGSYLSALLARPYPLQWSRSSSLFGCDFFPTLSGQTLASHLSDLHPSDLLAE